MRFLLYDLVSFMYFIKYGSKIHVYYETFFVSSENQRLLGKLGSGKRVRQEH